jgi:hypothetical protein
LTQPHRLCDEALQRLKDQMVFHLVVALEDLSRYFWHKRQSLEDPLQLQLIFHESEH